ncbi:MAG: LPS export ABC transporter periplasmic protein LptC, partial [Pacificimonas sp.]
LILAATLIWPLTQQREFSFILSKDRVDMAGDRMRLADVVYRGEDSEGRRFRITAGRGLQSSSADPRVVLMDLDARLEMDGGVARIEAPRGVYDLENERLTATGPVRMRRADGYRLVTSDIVIDLPSRTATAANADDADRIVGALPIGTFAGDKLSVDLEARTLILEGRTRMRIDPS